MSVSVILMTALRQKVLNRRYGFNFFDRTRNRILLNSITNKHLYNLKINYKYKPLVLNIKLNLIIFGLIPSIHSLKQAKIQASCLEFLIKQLYTTQMFRIDKVINRINFDATNGKLFKNSTVNIIY